MQSEENFLDDLQMSNSGVIVLNPDALQSQLMQDYMVVENTDIFELLESLKDSEFIYKHAQINEQLSSFEFPNLKSRMNNDVKLKYLKLLEKSVPKFDNKMHQLILKTPDPSEQIVGIIIPQNYSMDPS